MLCCVSGCSDCAVIPLTTLRSDNAPVDPRVSHVKQNVEIPASKSTQNVSGTIAVKMPILIVVSIHTSHCVDNYDKVGGQN